MVVLANLFLQDVFTVNLPKLYPNCSILINLMNIGRAKDKYLRDAFHNHGDFEN